MQDGRGGEDGGSCSDGDQRDPEPLGSSAEAARQRALPANWILQHPQICATHRPADRNSCGRSSRDTPLTHILSALRAGTAPTPEMQDGRGGEDGGSCSDGDQRDPEPLGSSAEAARQRALPANWILQHPQYQEMLSLDVGDEAQLHAAFLAYLDLTDVRQWQQVSSRGSSELQLVLLEGREGEGQPTQIIVPLPGHRSISHKWMRSLLAPPHPGAPPPPAVLLCAVASDSSLVYHRLTPGLVTPEPPDVIMDRGHRQHRKRRLH
ncbi:tRNA-splicing endonuclease subunit Sen15 isoform X2 [Amia ocellicauda]